jgi:hypothetical protein
MPGLDSLLAMWINVKYQQPVRRVYCPVCGGISEMRETERGLKCIYCGWHESGAGAPKFIPRTPDESKT